MAKKTITYNVCDRCGAEDLADEKGRSNWGEMTLNWKGFSRPAKAATSDEEERDSALDKGSASICEECTRSFRTWMLQPRLKVPDAPKAKAEK